MDRPKVWSSLIFFLLLLGAPILAKGQPGTTGGGDLIFKVVHDGKAVTPDDEEFEVCVLWKHHPWQEGGPFQFRQSDGLPWESSRWMEIGDGLKFYSGVERWSFSSCKAFQPIGIVPKQFTLLIKKGKDSMIVRGLDDFNAGHIRPELPFRKGEYKIDALSGLVGIEPRGDAKWVNWGWEAFEKNEPLPLVVPQRVSGKSSFSDEEEKKRETQNIKIKDKRLKGPQRSYYTVLREDPHFLKWGWDTLFHYLPYRDLKVFQKDKRVFLFGNNGGAKIIGRKRGTQEPSNLPMILRSKDHGKSWEVGRLMIKAPMGFRQPLRPRIHFHFGILDVELRNEGLYAIGETIIEFRDSDRGLLEDTSLYKLHFAPESALKENILKSNRDWVETEIGSVSDLTQQGRTRRTIWQFNRWYEEDDTIKFRSMKVGPDQWLWALPKTFSEEKEAFLRYDNIRETNPMDYYALPTHGSSDSTLCFSMETQGEGLSEKILHWVGTNTGCYVRSRYSYPRSCSGDTDSVALFAHGEDYPQKGSKSVWKPVKELKGAPVRDIGVDHDGTKWIAWGKGLVEYSEKEFRLFNPTNSPLPRKRIDRVHVNNGTVWAAVHGYGLASYRKGDWSLYGFKKTPIPSAKITCLASGSEGVLWIGTRKGLLRLDTNADGSKWDLFQTGNSDLPSDHISALYWENQKKLLVGTSEGLVIKREKEWSSKKNEHELPKGHIVSIVRSPLGNYWTGSQEGSIFSIDHYRQRHDPWNKR